MGTQINCPDINCKYNKDKMCNAEIIYLGSQLNCVRDCVTCNYKQWKKVNNYEVLVKVDSDIHKFDHPCYWCKTDISGKKTQWVYREIKK